MDLSRGKRNRTTRCLGDVSEMSRRCHRRPVQEDVNIGAEALHGLEHHVPAVVSCMEARQGKPHPGRAVVTCPVVTPRLLQLAPGDSFSRVNSNLLGNVLHQLGQGQVLTSKHPPPSSETLMETSSLPCAKIARTGASPSGNCISFLAINFNKLHDPWLTQASFGAILDMIGKPATVALPSGTDCGKLTLSQTRYLSSIASSSKKTKQATGR